MAFEVLRVTTQKIVKKYKLVMFQKLDFSLIKTLRENKNFVLIQWLIKKDQIVINEIGNINIMDLRGLKEIKFYTAEEMVRQQVFGSITCHSLTFMKDTKKRIDFL